MIRSLHILGTQILLGRDCHEPWGSSGLLTQRGLARKFFEDVVAAGKIGRVHCTHDRWVPTIVGSR